jgi:endonuclease/exonuclease/phosphatase (EEP) superfamily protein YafD
MSMTPRRAPGLVTRLFQLMVACTVLAVVIGEFGFAQHALDSLAHFRAHLAAALVVLSLLAFARRFWATGLGALLGAALGFGTSLPTLLGDPGDDAFATAGAYTLLQMNLRYDTADKTEALERIAETRPDVVTLQEVNTEWQALFANLSVAYPYQAYCGTENRDGVAILSRRPFSPDPATERCRKVEGLITRSVDFNGQFVGVSSLHLEWPWPRPQWVQIDRLPEVLAGLAQPSLLAGDFNATPWSAAVKAVAAAGGWRVVPGVGPSWMALQLPFLPAAKVGLPIDNLLVSPQVAVGEVRTLEATASDHLPVLMRFSLVRESDAPPVAVVGRPADPAS